MLSRHALASALCLALPLTACPRDPSLDLTRPALGPTAVGDHLVLADGDALVVLDLDDGALVATRRLPLAAAAPALVAAVPDSNAALVLSPDDRLLEVVSTDDSTDRNAHRTIDLGAPFEGLVVSPDGDLAIAYYPPGTADAVFHNENEIALVDLASGAVTRRTLASLGGGPRTIALSPVAGGRRFAFVLSDEHVAVLALDDLDQPERSVPLVSLASGGQRTPLGASFAVDPDGGALHAIIETAEATSVYALEVAPAPGDTPDFAVRLTQLAGISSGGAATLLALGGALYTLTSSPSAGTVTLTDLASATGSTLALGYGVDRLSLFDGPDGAPTALAWASRDGRRFSLIDLAALAGATPDGGTSGLGPSRAVDTRTTDDPFVALLPIPGTSRFVALHEDSDEGVSVIDAATSRVTGFGRTGDVADLQLVPALGRMFALTHAPDGADYVVSVDLATLHPEVARAPGGALGIAVLPGVGTVAAFDDRVGGHVALWPAAATGDERTRVVDGFLLDGLFQR